MKKYNFNDIYLLLYKIFFTTFLKKELTNDRLLTNC